MKACVDPKCAEALRVLREQTGSNNEINPWLGVTAGVQLLIMERDLLQSRLAEKSADNIRAYAEIGVLHGRLAECEKDRNIALERLAAAEFADKMQRQELAAFSKRIVEAEQWCERFRETLKYYLLTSLAVPASEVLADFEAWKKEKNL